MLRLPRPPQRPAVESRLAATTAENGKDALPAAGGEAAAAAAAASGDDPAPPTDGPLPPPPPYRERLAAHPESLSAAGTGAALRALWASAAAGGRGGSAAAAAGSGSGGGINGGGAVGGGCNKSGGGSGGGSCGDRRWRQRRLRRQRRQRLWRQRNRMGHYCHSATAQQRRGVPPFPPFCQVDSPFFAPPPLSPPKSSTAAYSAALGVAAPAAVRVPVSTVGCLQTTIALQYRTALATGPRVGRRDGRARPLRQRPRVGGEHLHWPPDLFLHPQRSPRSGARRARSLDDTSGAVRVGGGDFEIHPTITGQLPCFLQKWMLMGT